MLNKFSESDWKALLVDQSPGVLADLLNERVELAVVTLVPRRGGAQ